MIDLEIQHWVESIENIIPTKYGHVRSVCLIAETNSTQLRGMERCRNFGEVIVAGRQISGKGRRGNLWVDTLDAGIAASFILPLVEQEFLSIAMAVAMARTAELITQESGKIKWPNDLFYFGKKCGGVLIEKSTHDSFIVGIGINVLNRIWPDHLKNSVITLEEVSKRKMSRIDVLLELINQVDWALSQDEKVLEEFFKTRCLLTDKIVIISEGDYELQGTVRRIDPFRGLEIETESGLQWVKGALASIKEIL